MSFIALGLIALLLRGVFTKDAHTRAATFLALMWLVPLSVGFSIFLVWSMRISYREITNHEPPNVSGEIDDVKDAIKSTFGSKKSAYHPGPAPVAGTGGPVFMSPPARSRGAETAPQTGPIKASSGGRPAPKKRLPPPPEEKSFKDDPGAAIEALEAIEE